MQIFLVSVLTSVATSEREETPFASHVYSLWRMKKETRLAVWRKAQEDVQLLEELGFGGEYGRECTVDDEELSVFCTVGVPLQGLTRLHLSHGKGMSDASLRLLTIAGCGANLTSVTLECEFICCPFGFSLSRICVDMCFLGGWSGCCLGSAAHLCSFLFLGRSGECD